MDFQIKKSIKEKYYQGFIDPVYFHLEILERDLHKEQKLALPGLILNNSFLHCGNRWGKGDLILGKQAYLAFYKPVPKKFKERTIPILNSSISQDQANIIFNKFNENLTNKKYFSWMIKDIKRSPFPHIIFKNDVIWWFRNASQNGKFLEGHSYFDINFDECDLYDNYYKFVTEILQPRAWDFGGYISSTTTPRRGKKNSYKLLDEMKKKIELGQKDIFVFNGDSRSNTFLHPSAIDKMNQLPARLLNKNVRGLFEDSDGDISMEHIDYAESISIGLKDSPSPGKKYVNAWDLARSSTFCCGVTLEVDLNPDIPLQLVSWERFQDSNSKNKKYWQMVINKIKNRHQKWGKKSAIDKTGLGDVVFSLISDINPIGIQFASGGGKLRDDIIAEGISTFELGMIGIPPSIEQVLDNNLWRMADELTDFDKENTDVIIWDMVCAIFIAIWVARGHQVPGHQEKRNKPSIVGVRGASKYGYR